MEGSNDSAFFFSLSLVGLSAFAFRMSVLFLITNMAIFISLFFGIYHLHRVAGPFTIAVVT